MRAITGMAIALTTLFLSLVAARAEGTWCANYGGNGGTRSYDPLQATNDGIFHVLGPGSETAPAGQPVQALP